MLKSEAVLYTKQLGAEAHFREVTEKQSSPCPGHSPGKAVLTVPSHTALLFSTHPVLLSCLMGYFHALNCTVGHREEVLSEFMRLVV